MTPPQEPTEKESPYEVVQVKGRDNVYPNPYAGDNIEGEGSPDWMAEIKPRERVQIPSLGTVNIDAGVEKKG